MATVRQAVRVLLIDPADRVLLMGLVAPDSGIPFWTLIGGGIEAGESVEDAVRREVYEEVGLRDFEIGPLVWTRRSRFIWAGVHTDQREQIFLIRTPAFEPVADNHDAMERTVVMGLRWWSAEELRAATEELAPRDLAALYTTLLIDGPPSQPLHLEEILEGYIGDE